MQGMKSGLLLLLPPLALAGNHWNVTLPGGSDGWYSERGCHVQSAVRVRPESGREAIRARRARSLFSTGVKRCRE